MKNYTVLKDFGDVKEGAVLSQEDVASWTPEELAERLADGTLVENVSLSGETVSYVVTQEWLDLNPGTDFKIGDEIEIPKEVADQLPKVEGAPTGAVADEIPADEVPQPATEKPLIYGGKVVIADGHRTVGETEFHHIRTEDGAEFDLTDADYQAMVDSSK